MCHQLFGNGLTVYQLWFAFTKVPKCLTKQLKHSLQLGNPSFLKEILLGLPWTASQYCFGKVFLVWNVPAFYFMHANCQNRDGNKSSFGRFRYYYVNYRTFVRRLWPSCSDYDDVMLFLAECIRIFTTLQAITFKMKFYWRYYVDDSSVQQQMFISFIVYKPELKMLGLYLYTLEIGQKSCNMLSILN